MSMNPIPLHQDGAKIVPMFKGETILLTKRGGSAPPDIVSDIKKKIRVITEGTGGPNVYKKLANILINQRIVIPEMLLYFKFTRHQEKQLLLELPPKERESFRKKRRRNNTSQMRKKEFTLQKTTQRHRAPMKKAS